MATVRNLCTTALGELGIVAAGEVPTGQEETDAFAALNRVVDAMAAERLQIFTITRTTWTITANDGTYQVGLTAAAGNPIVARPVIVDHINFIDTSQDPDLELPLTLLTDDAWALITVKSQTSTYPTLAYYNPTFPLGTIQLWPIPTSTTLQGALYAPAALAEFTSLDQDLALPPGYYRMLVKNLAVDIAPSYERDVPPALAHQARESIKVVKRANYRLRDLSIDKGALPQGRYGYGWYSLFGQQ